MSRSSESSTIDVVKIEFQAASTLSGSTPAPPCRAETRGRTGGSSLRCTGTASMVKPASAPMRIDLTCATGVMCDAVVCALGYCMLLNSAQKASKVSRGHTVLLECGPQPRLAHLTKAWVRFEPLLGVAADVSNKPRKHWKMGSVPMFQNDLSSKVSWTHKCMIEMNCVPVPSTQKTSTQARWPRQDCRGAPSSTVLDQS